MHLAEKLYKGIKESHRDFEISIGVVQLSDKVGMEAHAIALGCKIVRKH